MLSSEEEKVEEVEEDDMTFFRKDRMEVDSSQVFLLIITMISFSVLVPAACFLFDLARQCL